MNTTRINGDRSFPSLSPPRCKFFFRRFSLSLRNHIQPFVSQLSPEFSRLFRISAVERNFLARTSQALSIDATYFSFVATGGSYFRINASEKKKARRAFLPLPTLATFSTIGFQRRIGCRGTFDEVVYRVKRKSNHGRPINKSV